MIIGEPLCYWYYKQFNCYGLDQQNLWRPFLLDQISRATLQRTQAAQDVLGDNSGTPKILLEIIVSLW